MRTRIYVWPLVMILLATVPFAQAQPNKVFSIGYLSQDDATIDAARFKLLSMALRDLGYIEGQNLSFERRHLAGGSDKTAAFAADLVRLKVDAILIAAGDNAIRAAMDATKTIPIILSGGGSDPVKAGFVQSLARPGGNVTGVTILTRELGGKRLGVFKDAVPKLARVAVLHTANAGIEVKEELPPAARALKLSLQSWEIRSVESLDAIFDGLNKEPPHGLFVVGGGTLIRKSDKRIVNYSVNKRLPSIFAYPEAVDAGGLISYQASIGERFQRVAYFIDRILKGAKPADLPVEQPTKFEFLINLKTAKQIGVNIPPEVLARATRVIR